MTKRPSWDAYYLGIAKQVARRSTCLRIPNGMGAVLVQDRRQIGAGYAGSITGQPHCMDAGVGCLMDEKYGGCVRTVHAEINAILDAAKNGAAVNGATLYATQSPCLNCFKALANAGVRRIVFAAEYRIVEPQKSWAREMGIPWDLVVADVPFPGNKDMIRDVRFRVEDGMVILEMQDGSTMTMSSEFVEDLGSIVAKARSEVPQR